MEKTKPKPIQEMIYEEKAKDALDFSDAKIEVYEAVQKEIKKWIEELSDMGTIQLWTEFWREKTDLYGKKGFDDIVEGKYDISIIEEFVVFCFKKLHGGLDKK